MYPKRVLMAPNGPLFQVVKFRISTDLKDRIKKVSVMRGESVSVIVREALRSVVDPDQVNFSRRNNSGVQKAGTPEGSKMGTAGAELAPANLAEGAQ